MWEIMVMMQDDARARQEESPQNCAAAPPPRRSLQRGLFPAQEGKRVGAADKGVGA